MKIALLGAEVEENVGLRYMATALERSGHHVWIIPFNSEHDTDRVVDQVIVVAPEITGLSMVFTRRAREFCRLAQTLRNEGYKGHLIAGGPFASFNCERLLQDFPAFDSVALGEGEELICALTRTLSDVSDLPGLCYRHQDGSVRVNPSAGNPADLDALPFPRRTTFRTYFGKPIATILTSRGCWRNCTFCSVNAWYKKGVGRPFRVRSVDNIIEEIKDLYFDMGVRIFNFQDDNFFLPNPQQALRRFQELRKGLERERVIDIAIAVKARPDSITYDCVRVLDDLGLFRVFLGVENASEKGLRNLNRECDVGHILRALEVLNGFDVHIAYNILMFEPDTVLEDVLTNLRFMERHMENPFNFCRAEAYAGTGLEAKLRSEGRLLGDYFGLDYRLKDARSEVFHEIANHAFVHRNFDDCGLHYFNMRVDFCFQLLKRFYPDLVTQSLRASVRNFIKLTNLDTYECLSEIYDFVVSVDPTNRSLVKSAAREMRRQVDERSGDLHARGERLLGRMTDAYESCRLGELALSAAREIEPPVFWEAP